MQRITKVFLFAVLTLPFGINAFAGCMADGCTSSNQYCKSDSEGCTDCPDTHPNSAVGTVSMDQCYKTCSNLPAANGTWITAEATVTYDNECTYTLTCNSPTANAGFHPEGASCTNSTTTLACNCESNTRPCDKDNGDGETYWASNTNAWMPICILTGCDAGYHASSDDPGTASCVSNARSCIDDGLSHSDRDAYLNWTGDWTYTTAKHLAARKSCFQRRQETAPTKHGSAYFKCPYISTDLADETYSTSCTYDKMVECDPGYYFNATEDPNQCIETEKGYYSDDGSVDKKPCPGGTTTDGPGSDSRSDCHTLGGVGGTKFCDKNGCFYLPKDVKVVVQ